MQRHFKKTTENEISIAYVNFSFPRHTKYKRNIQEKTTKKINNNNK